MKVFGDSVPFLGLASDYQRIMAPATHLASYLAGFLHDANVTRS
jgi:hypothetical protein